MVCEFEYVVNGYCILSNGYKLPFVQIPGKVRVSFLIIIVYYTKMNLSGELSKSC